ncbi:hypothetical protein FRC08_017172 [Ceratobasidium sp. 394]|nr:hypothetical protein FRC08_017172 [Ceratobasidium sp. 394]KAG9095595.1 hypothetical protein FS749_010153 [Ceratobasidium sp. UAMH 11750]
MKRSPGKDEGLAQVEPKLADNNPLDAESAKDDFGKFLRRVDGTSTSGLKPRRTGRLIGRAGWEATMTRDNLTTTGSRSADAGAEHTIAATPSPFQPCESGGNSGPGPLPKPVVNVAYFGDSGRSPPVPSKDQAHNERAILVTGGPSKSKQPGAAPVTLVTASDEGPKDEGTIRVYLVGPGAKSKGTAEIVSVSKPDSTHDWDESADSLPVEVSDWTVFQM